LATCLDPVDAGEVDVEDNQVGWSLARVVEAALGVPEGGDLIRLLLEKGLNGSGHLDVVLDNQHRERLRGSVAFRHHSGLFRVGVTMTNLEKSESRPQPGRREMRMDDQIQPKLGLWVTGCSGVRIRFALVQLGMKTIEVPRTRLCAFSATPDQRLRERRPTYGRLFPNR
jgi:hypothetical protein